MRKLVLVLGVLAYAACSGEAGPTGPSGPTGPVGPQGPQGPAGDPAVVSSAIVVIDFAGGAGVSFSNTQVETSVITCYTSDSRSGPWIVVAIDTLSEIACGVQNSGSSLFVVLVNGRRGWYFLVTVATAG